MLGLPFVFFVEHIEGFSVECEIFVVNAVGQFPGLGVQVDFCCFGGGADRSVGYEVVLFLR